MRAAELLEPLPGLHNDVDMLPEHQGCPVTTYHPPHTGAITMGSSTSKPRKGHKNPKHLAKVGSPQNRAWEHDQRSRRAFGPGWIGVVAGVLLVVVLISWIALTA